MIWQDLWKKEMLSFGFLGKGNRETTKQELIHGWNCIPVSLHYLVVSVDNGDGRTILELYPFALKELLVMYDTIGKGYINLQKLIK